MAINTMFGSGTVLAVSSAPVFVPLTGYASLGNVLNVRVIIEIQGITAAQVSITPAYQICQSADIPSFTGTACGSAQTTNTISFPGTWTAISAVVAGSNQLIRFGALVAQTAGVPGGAWVSVRGQLYTQ